MTPRKELATLAVRAAAEFRAKHEYRRDVPICPFDAATNCGLQVMLTPIPSLEGMYCKDRGPSIVVSTERPLGRQSFTAAHELGHHEFGHGTRADEYLGENTTRPSFDPDEFTADIFATHLLMPPTAVRTGFAARNTSIATASPVDVYAVSNWLGVGYETLIGHLEMNLALISNTKADALRRVTPKSIREQLLGQNLVPHLVVADTAWKDRTIDLRIGDGVLLANDIFQEGDRLHLEKAFPNGRLAIAVKRGVGRVESPSTGWCCFIRVMPCKYEGLSRFRFDEDPDENIGADRNL